MKERPMNNPISRACVEVLGLYGSGVEYWLRANRLLFSGLERTLQAQVDLADATTEHIATLRGSGDLNGLTAAQGALLKEVGEDVLATLRQLLEIQRETGADLKALAEEGVQSFTPAPVKPLMRKAA
jgi:phasin family protein